MHNKDNPKYRLYLAGIITENQYLEDAEERKTIFVLVGPPAVGKSTWIKETFRDEPYIINRDSIAEEVARGMGMTYDDMFSAPPEGSIEGSKDGKYGTVVKSPPSVPWQSLSYSKILAANSSINGQLKGKMAGAATSGRDIVVDMTNMTARARSQALSAVAGRDEMFRKVAVVFPFEGAEEVIQKIAFKRSREIKFQGGSKTIPPEVLERMMRSFEKVSNEEGFDDVVNVDNREKLRMLSR